MDWCWLLESFACSDQRISINGKELEGFCIEGALEEAQAGIAWCMGTQLARGRGSGDRLLIRTLHPLSLIPDLAYLSMHTMTLENSKD